jgi:hypothetical protein
MWLKLQAIKFLALDLALIPASIQKIKLLKFKNTQKLKSVPPIICFSPYSTVFLHKIVVTVSGEFINYFIKHYFCKSVFVEN